MDIGNKIKNIRKKDSLTQIEFSKQIGISRNALINYEKGTRTPPVDVLLKIASYFDEPISELMNTTPTLSSDEAKTLQELNLVEASTKSSSVSEKDSLSKFVDFLDSRGFPIEILSPNQISIMHVQTINFLESELIKIGFVKVEDND